MQGGLVPSWHTTTVVPEFCGTTTVVFAGGEGLLLLIHPPNIDAAISMLHRTFIIVSCEIAAISVHRESLQFGSGD